MHRDMSTLTADGVEVFTWLQSMAGISFKRLLLLWEPAHSLCSIETLVRYQMTVIGLHVSWFDLILTRFLMRFHCRHWMRIRSDYRWYAMSYRGVSHMQSIDSRQHLFFGIPSLCCAYGVNLVAIAQSNYCDRFQYVNERLRKLKY